jgi:CTP:molybdopterin cytidylyltransferase MocA
MRRGHPWLVARPLWADLLALQPPETTRAFLNSHTAAIAYVDASNDSILRDLDTPEDYIRERPLEP